MYSGVNLPVRSAFNLLLERCNFSLYQRLPDDMKTKRTRTNYNKLQQSVEFPTEFPVRISRRTRDLEVTPVLSPWQPWPSWPKGSVTGPIRICAFANNQYAIEHALGDFRLQTCWARWILSWEGDRMGQKLWILPWILHDLVGGIFFSNIQQINCRTLT